MDLEQSRIFAQKVQDKNPLSTGEVAKFMQQEEDTPRLETAGTIKKDTASAEADILDFEKNMVVVPGRSFVEVVTKKEPNFPPMFLLNQSHMQREY